MATKTDNRPDEAREAVRKDGKPDERYGPLSDDTRSAIANGVKAAWERKKATEAARDELVAELRELVDKARPSAARDAVAKLLDRHDRKLVKAGVELDAGAEA